MTFGLASAVAALERRFDTSAPESISQNPSRPLLSALGLGEPSSSGVHVTQAKAEGIPAIFAAVSFLAETVGQTPLKLMRDTEAGRKPDLEHPLYTLLHDLPNPEMSALDFRACLMRWLCLWGNAYAEIRRDASGRVVALWPLRSDAMSIGRDSLNRLTYRYQPAMGEEIRWTFNAARPPILHLRINSLDGIVGRSPVQVLRDSLGLTLANSEYSAKFYANGGNIRGVLTHPLTFSKPEAKQDLREQWQALYGGSQNAHKVAILEQGMTYTPIGVPPGDAQFLETRKFQLEEAARLYRVPLHLINSLERSTNNNIEHQGLEVVKFTLMPYFVSWEQAIRRDLLTIKSFNTHRAVFIVDGLVRGDLLSRTQAYTSARQWGWMSANDILRLEDQPTIGPKGDRYLEPMNMTEAGTDPVADEGTDGVEAPVVDEPKGVM